MKKRNKNLCLSVLRRLEQGCTQGVLGCLRESNFGGSGWPGTKKNAEARPWLCRRLALRRNLILRGREEHTYTRTHIFRTKNKVDKNGSERRVHVTCFAVFVAVVLHVTALLQRRLGKATRWKALDNLQDERLNINVLETDETRLLVNFQLNQGNPVPVPFKPRTLFSQHR